MRADLELFPLFQAFVKSAMASDGGRTSRVTVFTVPPRNVGTKGRNQLVWICEGEVALLAFVVPVIAFARFVVVAQDALAMDDIGKAMPVAGAWGIVTQRMLNVQPASRNSSRRIRGSTQSSETRNTSAVVRLKTRWARATAMPGSPANSTMARANCCRNGK